MFRRIGRLAAAAALQFRQPRLPLRWLSAGLLRLRNADRRRNEVLHRLWNCNRARRGHPSATPVSESGRGAELAPTIIEKVVIPLISSSPQTDVACRKCNAMVRGGQKFCEKCGTPVALQGISISRTRIEKFCLLHRAQRLLLSCLSLDGTCGA